MYYYWANLLMQAWCIGVGPYVKCLSEYTTPAAFAKVNGSLNNGIYKVDLTMDGKSDS